MWGMLPCGCNIPAIGCNQPAKAMHSTKSSSYADGQVKEKVFVVIVSKEANLTA